MEPPIHVCLKNLDGKVQGRSNRATLCIRRSRESLRLVPREELWYCMRKSGILEMYVRLVQDMYEESETVVRFAVGTTESFKVEVGLHQGSALSLFLFAMIMDRLTDKVRRELPSQQCYAGPMQALQGLPIRQLYRFRRGRCSGPAWANRTDLIWFSVLSRN